METPAEAWVTITWDNPVNLMGYVTHVFCEYFGYPGPKSKELTLKVRTGGRAVASADNHEAMEHDVLAMRNYTLWAIMKQQWTISLESSTRVMDVVGYCVSLWNTTHMTWNRYFPISNPTIP